ncbi:MAG: hypothetical protein JOZ42_07880 [Acetobacteraceae bacterium]|nr:hypothetical protein [Acetobacteraceae bacterium]
MAGSCRLQKLKAGRNGPPIFLMHGVGGPHEIETLGTRLGGEHAVYAPRTEDIPELRAMADATLAAIWTVQPHGPYLFVGFSFGGFVAIEMARAVREAGMPVALLACLDTLVPRRHWPKAERRAAGAMRLRHYARQLASPGRVAERATRALRRQDRSAAAEPSAIEKRCMSALASYVPHRYPGKIVFFAPRRRIDHRNPLSLWRGLAGELSVRMVDGDHHSMIAGEVDDLLGQLDDCIAAALRGGA